MERAAVDSLATLTRIHEVIKETITPTWIANPPADVGLPRAGTLKADHWQTLFAIHIPLALLSLWKEDSPIAAPNAKQMTSVLSTSMHLTCATNMMTKRTLTPQSRDLYRHSLRQHVMGLKENFPSFILPSHHLAFHIYEFMDSFSAVRNWWLFPFENLIGKLQRMPTNHKIGTPTFYQRIQLRSKCPQVNLNTHSCIHSTRVLSSDSGCYVLTAHLSYKRPGTSWTKRMGMPHNRHCHRPTQRTSSLMSMPSNHTQ